jgi:hypothetical protein
MKKFLVAVAIVAVPFVWSGGASAAPINCPGAQVTVHNAGDQWDCVNPAGNTNESDQEKNDNHPN